MELKILALLYGMNTKNIRGDIFGGITAAVSALPLALAFGEQALGSGGAIYGLYGAIITGFLAALFGGTPAQVTGPTGPMSVTVNNVRAALLTAGIGSQMQQLGIPPGEQLKFLLPALMAAVVVGGLFQILFGLLKLGKYITLVPYSVISGFMSGIGFIIIAISIGPLIGVDTSGPGGASGALFRLFETVTAFDFKLNLVVCGISIMTAGVLFFTPKKISQWIPSPLLALILVTTISLVFFQGADIPRIEFDASSDIGIQLTDFNKLGEVTDNFNIKYTQLIVQTGLILAVLGAIDSLLTSLVADNISETRHNSDRELIGQGIGNAVSGLFQGLPGAGATMRTVINVKSGGKTPISGMSHSIVLLLVLYGAGGAATTIPNAVLSAILIKVGLDIVDWRFLLRAHRLSLKTATVMWGVLLLTVFWGLIEAVLVGVFVANLLTIDSITQSQLADMDADLPLDDSQVITGDSSLPDDEKALLEKCSGEVMLFRLKGPLSFGAAKGITERMMLIRNYKVLILDITEVPRLGVTATLAIEDMVHEAQANSRKAFVVVTNNRVKSRLNKFGIKGIINSRKEALEVANSIISN